MTDTSRVTDRRRLSFASMSDVLDDVDYLASGDPPRTAGNWSPAQIVRHVRTMITCSIDGFPVPRVDPVTRIVCRLLRNRILTTPLRAGLRFPHKFSFLAPDDDASWDEEVEQLHQAVGRLDSERMTHPSPVLGSLTHDQWEQFHCRHSEMHFSFMHPA